MSEDSLGRNCCHKLTLNDTHIIIYYSQYNFSTHIFKHWFSEALVNHPNSVH